MSRDERIEFWKKQFDKCVKCYGCVDICPVTPEDSGTLDIAKWVTPGITPPDYPMFHLIRAYQVWDTCILCAECEITCPAGIPLKAIQDLVQYLPPEKVFEVIPGLPKEAQDAIIGFVEEKKKEFSSAAGQSPEEYARRIVYEY